MDTKPFPGAHGAAAARAVSVPAVPVWLLAAVVAIVAILPRTLGLADFTTIDESYHWVSRVSRFSDALSDQSWRATIQTGHPGVTTMWLGSIGRAIAGELDIARPGKIGGGVAYLALLRLPLAAVNGALVVAGFLLLRRMLRPGVALLAALLWATAPFLVAHSRLLHVDGLLTSFMTLSLLLLLAERPAASEGRRTGGQPRPVTRDRRPTATGRWPLALSAVFAGMALLTKAPSLILLPTVGLLMFGLALEEGGAWASPRGWAAALRRVIPRYLLWLALAAGVAFAGWPALWVAPGEALGRVLGEIVENGGVPTEFGNYFNGQAVPDPGPLFYLAVLLWRITPLTLVGLAALPLALALPLARSERRALVALLLFALLFGGVMSVEPKKFDRYLLPIWPAVEVLAAAGLAAIYDLRHTVFASLRRRGMLPGPLPAALHGAVVAVAAGALAIPLAVHHPYYLAYFNPLLGGGPVAQRVMLVGWGEGMNQVGAWLSTRPDLGRGPVLSWTPPNLAPFLPRSARIENLTDVTAAQPSSYAVLYVRSVQRRESAAAEALVRQTPPLYTLRLFGVEYATVHQLPRPFATARDAVFGEGVHLRGFSQERVGATLVITPSWDIQQSRPGGVVTFLHVLNERGERVAQVDAPLDQGVFRSWQAGQQFDSPLPVALPPDVPAGRYRVVLGLYLPESGERLPLTRGDPLPEAVSGPHVVELTTIAIE